MSDKQKYGVLVVGTESQINIGDYIQGLAARQFLPHVDEFIERERLKDYNGPNVKVIMNAWYMHHPEQFPPSSQIEPLYVAVHINDMIKKDFSESGKLSAFSNSQQEIGCRDENTAEYLKLNGINAYFSGCLTLTLGNTYRSIEKDNKVYIVDPVIPAVSGWMDAFYSVFKSLRIAKRIKLIFEKKYPNCSFAQAIDLSK